MTLDLAHLHSIGAGARLLGLESRKEDGPKTHGLSVWRLFLLGLDDWANQDPQSTLDHSIWFYACAISPVFFTCSLIYPRDEFDCSDWLLFEVCTDHEKRATVIIGTIDSSPPSRLRESSGPSQGEPNRSCGVRVSYERKPLSQVFTREGVLIAHCSQEGVVRARVFPPEESEQTRSKL